MINKYIDEIKSILRSRNIFIEGDYESACLGLLIDKLNNGVPSEKSICISNTLPSEMRNYNIIFAKDLDQNSLADSKEDKVLNTYFKTQVGFDVKFYFQEINDIQVCWIKTAQNYQYNSAQQILCGLTPKFLKGYFSQETIINNRELLKGLIDTKDFKQYVIDFALVDFKSIEINYKRKRLESCMIEANERRIRNADSELRNLRSQQRDLMNRYNDLNNSINRLLNIVSGAKNYKEELEEQVGILSDFLFNNSCIDVVEFEGSYIKYNVKTTLSFFNMEVYKSVASNLNAYMYTENRHYPAKKIQKLLDAIFVDRKYKVGVSGTYYLEFDRQMSINSNNSNHRELTISYPNLMPSPHQVGFHCAGDFPVQWNEALQNGNIILAIQATIGLIQNLNWNDGTVTSYFIRELMSTKCIADSEGNYYSGEDILGMLEG